MRDHRPTQHDPIPLTIAGSFGFGNAGDEGAPLAIEDIGRSLGVDIAVDVIGRFRAPANSAVIGLGDEDRMRRDAIAQQPLLYVGGGVIEPLPKAAVSCIGDWASTVDVPYTTLFGAAVEPLCKYGWTARRRLNRGLKHAQHLLVRDTLSAETLRELQPNRDIEVTGDVVLCMEPSAQVPEPLRGLDRYIAVNLSPRWRENAAWHPWIAQQIAAIAEEQQAAIVFVPCTQKHDRDQDEHETVTALLQKQRFRHPIFSLGDGYTPRDIAAAFGGAELVIAMRLHAAVMAYARQVPWIALAYHPKLSGFASTVDQHDRLVPRKLPNRQSTDAYGYTFKALNLTDFDLRIPAFDAMERASFHRLPALKQRLADALLQVLREAEQR